MFIDTFKNPCLENHSTAININCCAFVQCKEIGFNCVSWPLESFTNIKCKQSKFYFVCNHHYSRFNSLFSSINQMIISVPPTLKTLSPLISDQKIIEPIEKKKRGPKKGSKRIVQEKKIEKIEKTKRSHSLNKIVSKVQEKTYQTRGKISKEIEELEDFSKKFSFQILCEQACKIFDQEFQSSI